VLVSKRGVDGLEGKGLVEETFELAVFEKAKSSLDEGWSN